jgi:hypothetical protein
VKEFLYQRDSRKGYRGLDLAQQEGMKVHGTVRKPRLISERAPVHPVRVTKVRIPIHVVLPIVIGSREAKTVTPLSK